MSEQFELRSEFAFEAAHPLPAVAADHRWSRLHGHSCVVQVRVSGPLMPPYWWVVDRGYIEANCESVRDELDHRLLNDIPGLENPTSEVLARWVWRRLVGELPGISAVVVRETASSWWIYRAPGG